VPIWATPGVHGTRPPFVHCGKTHFPQTWFIHCISPYFYNSGKAFLQGLKELHGYFIVEDKSKDSLPITHQVFLDVLKKMFNGINPLKDYTSDKELKQGQRHYNALLAQGGTQEIAISVL
ncbi:hypothetical protein J3R83DRAFT_8201, partial [Lanmaoa asiatica]